MENEKKEPTEKEDDSYLRIQPQLCGIDILGLQRNEGWERKRVLI